MTSKTFSQPPPHRTSFLSNYFLYSLTPSIRNRFCFTDLLCFDILAKDKILCFEIDSLSAEPRARRANRLLYSEPPCVSHLNLRLGVPVKITTAPQRRETGTLKERESLPRIEGRVLASAKSLAGLAWQFCLMSMCDSCPFCQPL
jgi:hypothetical protein